MKSAKSALWAAKRIGLAVLVLGVALSALSCGKAGAVYGQVSVYDPVALDVSYFSSFPSYAYLDTYYQTQEGMYDFYFNLYDANYYYPAWYANLYDPITYPDPNDATLVYQGTYTVEADKGSLLADGKDNYFTLGLYYDGLYKIGSGIKSIVPSSQNGKPVAPQLGTKSWTENGMLITVTTKIVKLTPEQLKNQTHMKGK